MADKKLVVMQDYIDKAINDYMNSPTGGGGL